MKGPIMPKRRLPRPRRYVDPENFHLTRRMAGLSQQEAAAYLGVCLRTLRNWELGKFSIPYPAFKLLRMRSGGIVQAQGWEGWRFAPDGALWSPDGRSFKSWELYHLRLVFSMARHWQESYQASERARQGASVSAPAASHLRLVRGSGS